MGAFILRTLMVSVQFLHSQRDFVQEMGEDYKLIWVEITKFQQKNDKSIGILGDNKQATRCKEFKTTRKEEKRQEMIVRGRKGVEKKCSP